MKIAKILILMTIFVCLTSFVSADLSVQLKRVNDGVVGVKDGEIIFDLVNTDMMHKIEAFLLCRSPDDAVVSSTMGAGTGSGAQYVSPRFTINEAPSQKAMSLSIGSETTGQKSVSCEIKYIKVKDGKYLRVNRDYIASPSNSDYSVLRLDKSINFEAEIEEQPEPEPKMGFFARIIAWFKSLFS